MQRLTEKQEKFVQELVKGKSQREAYKEAYEKSRLWKDTAVDTQASILFKNSKVLERYNELMDRLVKESEDECIVTAKEELRELKRIGFADIKDYLSYKTAKTVVERDPVTGEPVIDYQQIIDVLDSDQVDGRVIQEVSIKRGTFTFKMYDKMAALDKLGKTLGMFTDKIETSGETTVNNRVDLTAISTEDLKKMLGDGSD